MGEVQEILLEQLHSSCITAPFPNVFNSVAQPEKLTYIKTTLMHCEEGRMYNQGTGSHHCCRLAVAVTARTATKEVHNSHRCFLGAFQWFEGRWDIVVSSFPSLVPVGMAGISPSAFSSTSWLEIPTPARAVLRQPWYFSSPIK